jgi:hypothetical protein
MTAWQRDVHLPSAVCAAVFGRLGVPEELRWLGFDLTETGETERILSAAIVEKFVAGGDGAFEPSIEGSTGPVAQTVPHADIVRGQRYTFCLHLPDVLCCGTSGHGYDIAK